MTTAMNAIKINLPAQTLTLHNSNDQVLFECLISTSKNGAGEENGSFKTPRGLHIIRAKIGGGLPVNTVFRARRPTGEVYSPTLAKQYPSGRDWILSRILWLSGCEVGKNRLGCVDTMRRYIYLHGTPKETVLGVPGSIGCVRIGNDDIVRLFDMVLVGTPVSIA